MVASSSECLKIEHAAFEPGLIQTVNSLVGDRVRRDVSAASLTTFSIGGSLAALITVESVEELRQVLSLLYREGQSVRMLGFGSNLLVSDAGVSGWVIKLGPQFREVREESEGTFFLGGAASLMSLSRKISDEGYAGFEFAAGIPASVGGAAFMNAGAHGADIGSRIVSVSGVLPNGEAYEWQGEELPWCYRFSGLPLGVVVTSIRVRLTPGDRHAIAKACAENLAHRRATQPLSLSSAGSVFKNPSPEQTAGRLLEAAGLKGCSVGGASVSMLHANWIVNPEKRASAADVRELIQRCIAQVKEQSGIELEPEVKIWE